MSDLRERIFSRSHIKRTTVDGFGETIGIREFSVPEAGEFLQLIGRVQKGDADSQDILLAAVVRGACDPDTGERLFTDGDLEWLSQQGAQMIGAVGRAVLKLNGLGGEGGDAEAGNS